MINYEISFAKKKLTNELSKVIDLCAGKASKKLYINEMLMKKFGLKWKKKLKQNKTKQKRDKRTKQKLTRTERRNAKQSVDIVFVYVLLFIRNFKLWRKKFGTAPPYILRISDKYKQQTIVKRKKKERQKKNE